MNSTNDTDNTQNDTSELRELFAKHGAIDSDAVYRTDELSKLLQVLAQREQAAEWREHIGAIKGEPTQDDTGELREQLEAQIYSHLPLYQEDEDLNDLLDALMQRIAQREQAAELRGRIDELGKTTEIWVHSQHEDDFSDYLQRRKTTLQATKPEKGTGE